MLLMLLLVQLRTRAMSARSMRLMLNRDCSSWGQAVPRDVHARCVLCCFRRRRQRRPKVLHREPQTTRFANSTPIGVMSRGWRAKGTPKPTRTTETTPLCFSVTFMLTAMLTTAAAAITLFGSTSSLTSARPSAKARCDGSQNTECRVWMPLCSRTSTWMRLVVWMTFVDSKDTPARKNPTAMPFQYIYRSTVSKMLRDVSRGCSPIIKHRRRKTRKTMTTIRPSNVTLPVSVSAYLRHSNHSRRQGLRSHRCLCGTAPT
mmetsp:Transcript_7856/g.21208  ORF Transcript_7856/g.21208 Transcript_7856/m.21208 type:complete len:260 (-) Transcript_7856:473-1252(-)